MSALTGAISPVTNLLRAIAAERATVIARAPAATSNSNQGSASGIGERCNLISPLPCSL